VPQNVKFAGAKLSGYSRNRFKIMPTGSNEAAAGRNTIFNLPENCLLDTASVRLHCQVRTTKLTGSGGVEVYGKLPADGSSLIQRLNLSINGVSVSNQVSEYNSLCRVLKLAGGSSRDRDQTVDRAVSHGAIDTSAAEEDVSLIISEWRGALTESSTRFWPLNALGAVQMELTWADNSVLLPIEDDGGTVTSVTKALDTAGDLSANAKAVSPNLSYSVSNLYLTVDTIQFGDGLYDQLLRKRLADEAFVPIYYRDYFSFSHDGINTDADTVRFAVAASSVDKCIATFRNGSYRSPGVRGIQLDNTIGDAYISNYFRFRSYDSQTTKNGTLKMQYRVNSTPHPTYPQAVTESLADIAYTMDKVGPTSAGIVQSSLEGFNDGQFAHVLTLAHPSGNMVGQLGLDSRGITSQFEFVFTGLSAPGASSAEVSGQQVATASAFIVVQVTSMLMLAMGREVTVQH